MKTSLRCFLILLFLASGAVFAGWRTWEFVNPADLEIRMIADQAEITSGEIATFTIRVRNKTDKAVKVFFPTGQRWDMAVFHQRIQIFRWSQGKQWMEAPHSIPILPGQFEEYKLCWRAVDRYGSPLPRGDYKVQGMVMTVPRYLVTNEVFCHLLPAKVQRLDVQKVKIGQFFEIKLPRFMDQKPVQWKVGYVYNDSRVSLEEERNDPRELTLIFLPKRLGHVDVILDAYPFFRFVEQSIERRTFRLEVVPRD